MNDRRKVLMAAVGGSVGLLSTRVVHAQGDPKAARPQPGDRFVYGEGERKGVSVKLEDLESGAPR